MAHPGGRQHGLRAGIANLISPKVNVRNVKVHCQHLSQRLALGGAIRRHHQVSKLDKRRATIGIGDTFAPM